MLKSMNIFRRTPKPTMIMRFSHETGRQACAVDNSPRCAPDKPGGKSDCEQKKESMWFNPKCCLDPCADAMPRFDELYYKPGDLTRKFTRTWAECPKLKIVPKKLCCFDQIDAVPFVPRPKRTACQRGVQSAGDNTLLTCRKVNNLKCQKIQWPGCVPARDPPRCFVMRKHTACKKRCTPYPSFSECNKCPRNPKRATECDCLLVHPYCPT